MPSREWLLRPAVEPTPELAQEVGGHPLVARILAQRGIVTPEIARAFLEPSHYRPAQPSSLPGIAVAARILRDAIQARQRVLVWGDFDVDGQTSTALLLGVLRRLSGEDRVHFHVPLRIDGHGIQVARLREALAEFRADMILTCDTGIAEVEAVTAAKQQGLTVVVTDHHELTDEFRDLRPGIDQLWGLSARQAPEGGVRRADAVVNPHFCAPGHPLRTLPGVGVAFLLAQELAAVCGQPGAADDMLDLVALGIVADVAQQVDDARYLLQRGLEQLRRTQRPGLLALMEFAAVTPATASAEAIGFQIGPRMNAVGRLDDATLGVELLTTTDPMRARTLAARVDRLNRERRVLSSETVAMALEMIDHQPQLLDSGILIVQHADWHPGILGIVAGRLVEEFHRPVAVILAPPGQIARGSARSVPQVHIGDALAACAPLLLTYGGHAGAAGFSLLPEKIESLRRELDYQVGVHHIAGAKAAETLVIDAELSPADATLETADELARLAPFGPGNPTPVFMASGLTVSEDRRLGQDAAHRRLTLRDAAGAEVPLIWFNGGDAEVPLGVLDAAFTLGVNEYRGRRTVQLQHVALQPTAEAVVVTPGHERATLAVVDCRLDAHALDHLPADALWYVEGDRDKPIGSMVLTPRHQLSGHEGGALILWSAPPSAGLLDWILESAAPHKLYLVGRLTSDDTVDGLVKAVAGMCKYSMSRGEPANIGRMAARIGATESLIRLSLLWLASRGVVRLTSWLTNDELQLAVGDGSPSGDHMPNADALELDARLREQVAEVRAYRRFFRTARLDQLGLDQFGVDYSRRP